MKLLSMILNHAKVSKVILRNLDVTTIRRYFGKEFLSPIENFILDGYHAKLYSDLPLTKESKVIILGGFEGTSAQLIHEKYSSEVYVVEPLPQYVQVLESKLKHSKFRIFNYAVSNKNGIIKIGIVGEKSGVRADSGQFFLAKSRKASDFIREIGCPIDLVEMNIEGSEYEVLSELIESSFINQIKSLLVQFHGDSIQDEVNRCLLRQKLSKTHKCVFNYLLVWERWDLLPE